MRKTALTALLIVNALAACLFSAIQAAASTLPRLQVSENQRYLVTTQGKPFFYLADTAWELFHRQEMKFAPPTKVAGEDWVLVLDDAARKYPAPGTQP